MIVFQCFAFLSSLALGSPPAKIKGEVIKNVQYQDCHDGDTCTFRLKDKKIKVRIFGIDAPEIGQELDTKSRDFVRETLAKAKEIHLECLGRSYQRKVCQVQVDKINLSATIIENGYAWEYLHFSKGVFSKDLEKAKNLKLGIWALKNPENPEEFRKRKKKANSKSSS